MGRFGIPYIQDGVGLKVQREFCNYYIVCGMRTIPSSMDVTKAKFITVSIDENIIRVSDFIIENSE